MGHRSFWSYFLSPRGQRNLLLLLMWLCVVAVLYVGRHALLPMLLAATMAYIIDPVVDWLSHIKIRGFSLPRTSSVLLVYGMGAIFWTVVVIVGLPILLESAKNLGAQILAWLQSVDAEAWANRLGTWLNDWGVNVTGAAAGGPQDSPVNHLVQINPRELIDGVIVSVKTWLEDQRATLLAQTQRILAGTLQFIFSIFVVLMISAFIILKPTAFKDFLFTLVPGEDRSGFEAFLKRVDTGLTGVIRGQVTICIVNGILTFVGLLLLSVPYAALLGTIAGVCSLIPVFGSILSTLPIVVVAFTVSPYKAVWAILWLGFIHLLEANLLNPKIMGDAAKLHPVIIVFALLVGEHNYGLAGALFAVPVASIVATLFRTATSRVELFDLQLRASSKEFKSQKRGLQARNRRHFRHP